uniref:zinc finger protein VAR3, chloroplastic-like n=1 Tax=Erigeron canadensis TaxID=72917 RepID=UPI001CB9557E|nr:zinc finger protein VAR3, chloroplastic-like [Erigeron canadensis]
MAGASSRLLSLIPHHHHRLRFYLFRLTGRRSLTTTNDHRHLLINLTPHKSFSPIKLTQIYYHSNSNNNNYAFQGNSRGPSNSCHVFRGHPWPEWSRLLESLYGSSYFNLGGNFEVEILLNENLPVEFIKDVNSCLAFARDRFNLISLLPRKDIEVVINNGFPFLFKSAHETERRMRAFLQGEESNQTTLMELMKYILSYVSGRIIYPERRIEEAIESSVRSLLQELTDVSYIGRPSEQYKQMPRNLGPNITMKRGDWICTKCSFMNFARNSKCLECEGPRPQTQLTSGEWACPRCNFFNYRKNMVCIKCEYSRPNDALLYEASPGQANTPYGDNGTPEQSFETMYVPSRQIQNADKEAKTENWFKKIKELHAVTGPTSDISHHDLSRIIPIRKEEDHFVENNKKDERFSLKQRHQAMEKGSNSSFAPFVPFPPGFFARKDDQQLPNSNEFCYPNNATFDKNYVQGTGNLQTRSTNNLDSTSSFSNITQSSGETNAYSSSNQIRRHEHDPEDNRTLFDGDMNTSSSSNHFKVNEHKPEGYQTQSNRDTNANSFSYRYRKNDPRLETTHVGQRTPESMNVRSGWTGKSLEGSAVTESDPLDMSEEAKAERWFRRVAQIKDISELSQIPDEDFPSIMPMRKGVNRFVVSKRKTPLERRLTSSQYRKNLRIMSSDPMKKEGEDDN